jgi:hypothetical protein
MTIHHYINTTNIMPWKEFIAGFVVVATATKRGRQEVAGYQVKQARGGYHITVHGTNPGYGFMSADTLYSWMERLPLVYFARQADEWREEIAQRHAAL